MYVFCSQIIRFHHKWREITFSFLGKFMRGQNAIMVREMVPVFPVAMCFNSLLVNDYIHRNAKPNTIKYIDTLAKDLLEVFKRKLKRNKWLLPKTKAYALTKLDKLHFIYGSTTEVREDPVLPYSATDIWENLVRICGWRADSAIQLEGKGVIDIPTIDWSNYPLKFTGKQCYIVNAFYTPVENSIYIPLAYMQKPFIDLEERGIEYNLAYIGYTLGHEMSHSLDSLGSRYDADGNLRNWWGKEDREIYKRIQRDVIAQYEEYARRDGIEFDASSSIGEDIADISGTSIMIEYLKDFQEKNEDIIPIRVLSYKAFFVYYAVQSRQLVGKKAIQAQLKTNPHPLDKYRVNIPLSRLAIFREMYGVKEGDGMYWHNTSTIC
jgi:predicted metalloendopeptidase